ncbi:hypothetical protein COV93_08760 [Candidatus Woesearchaeota archaeon CG11_big_fil_rev_8_21_14_0_20_43_8]|nr:MAG: hypothetical protein COV93_08760 [Candidatus Woesearchaeota archaeon CG11_big_fil_rev_8_21_14_0_20_43_8]PIO04581.1 MAG: FAD:protein FMN transferase [Candidatus Woesearchaeota archaeon CG08_land_8_20_14_0_20_43_7]
MLKNDKLYNFFLLSSAVMGIRRVSLVLLVFVFIFAGCSYETENGPSQELSDTRTLMGTEVTITIITNDTTNGHLAIDSAFDAIGSVEDMMSSYRNNSELSRLNQEKKMEVSEPLSYNIKKSIHYSNISAGAFDISIDPILKIWDNVKYTGKIPTEEEVNETLNAVGWKRINITGDVVQIGDDMSLNLGGIAKGYAIDMAIGSLISNKIKDALVDAGGDIRTIGSKGGSPWRIALQNPRDKTQYLTIIDSFNGTVVTSGDYERYFITDGKKIIHIADPRTGYSAEGLISVTIATSLLAIDADALSTAVFVLGKDDGMKLVESLDHVEALIVTEDGEVIRSSGFG